ncbi:hypothetical protein HK105_207026 [Polyrhizophydium stewartii]|uniref:Cation-transporting P-type ATPase C-terminal domain-containing protein n=1 Tax=Polyrhizophydium stewartii TaxID=2732419 RepID=A0ABR4N1N1_9FUNG|nr:hypothetical protein HK105_004808 [Polyrhizophydium stewartii]
MQSAGAAPRQYIYLSHAEATARFVHAADAVLAEQRRRAVPANALQKYLLRADVLLTVLFALGLVGFYGFVRARNGPFQWRATGALAEGVILLLVVALNCWLHVREIHLAALEMSSRIQNTVELVRKNGISDSHDFRFPTNILTAPLTRVVRDGIVRLLPPCLLVEGDVILLAYGDTAPCRIRFLFATSAAQLIEMQPGQIFKPDLFASIADPRRAQEAFGILASGAFYFTVIDTPIKGIIQSALNAQRPETVIAHQLELVDRLFLTRVIWIVFGASLLVNVLRFVLVSPSTLSSRADQAYEMFVNLQFYVLFPLIPLSHPTLFLVSRSYGNAQIVCLFEALQSSKTAFEDDEDVDEFDAAPAPTKDVAVSWAAIWRKFLDQIIRIDISFLARTTGLIESLANTTVICAIDREGTISSPLPSVEQLFLIGEAGEPIILDVTEDRTLPNGMRFEDRDWSHHLSLLKPLGLSLMLNTDCGAHAGRRRNESHLKSGQIRVHGTVNSARQTCICGLGAEIGFSKESLSQFACKASIELFAPSHPAVSQSAFDYHFEIPSLSSRIFYDAASASFQLFSEGHAELILESCGDYWNGRELGQMAEPVESKILDFYQNAVISDLQVVAFAYRPINNPAPVLFQGGAASVSPIYLEHTETPPAPKPFEFPETSQSDGGASSQAHPASSSGEPGYVDQTGLHDHSTDVNMAATPSQDGRQHQLAGHPAQPTHPSGDSVTAVSDVSNAAPQPTGRPRRQANRSRAVSKIDSPVLEEPIGDNEFFHEAIKGQTFLAMASYTFAPKPNMVDVIEDLALAGIRFVYFSSAPERESKAYAEHLGLEVDWNCCIILSPEGVGPGYLAIHDMKAGLPKGVENIRSHIANVDDVPLHVSLFAECQPYSIREMVRIFQEHGEVVCCIGSSLNDLNTECFAMADISISVDPLHLARHRHGAAQIGPLSPLAVAASFNSSPCALNLNVDTSMYSITQIIREARTLAGNGRQGFAFYMGCQFALSATLFLSYCLLLPPIFTGYQLIFMAWVLLPLVSIGFMFSPHLPDVMTNMPVKNAEHLRDMWRFVSYFCLRFCLVPSVVCVIVFALVVTELHDPDKPFMLKDDYFGVPWLRLADQDQRVLLFAQNFTLYVFVLYMVAISATYLRRVESIFEDSPLKSTAWLLCSVICLAVQAAFFAISQISSPFGLGDVSWPAYVIAFGGLLVLLPIQELVKRHDKLEWVRFQKRSKLEFNTKLGMYSPI